MEVRSITKAVVSRITEIDVKTVVVTVLHILKRDAREVQLFDDVTIGAINLEKALVVMVIVGKQHLVKKHQSRTAIQ
jgi:hypothetical protein